MSKYEDLKSTLAKRVLADKIVPVGSTDLKLGKKPMLTVAGEGHPILESAVDQYLLHIGFTPGKRFLEKALTVAPTETEALIGKYAKDMAEKKLIVRTETYQKGKPVVRCVGSEKFTPLDDHVLLDAVEETLSGYEWEPGPCFRTPTVSHYTFKFPKYTFEPLPKDVHFGGIRLINSEVGYHSLGVQCWVMRQVCTNGAVAPVSVLGHFRKYHVSLTVEELVNMAQERVLAGIKALDTTVGLLKRQTEIVVPDVEQEFKALKMKYGISEKLLTKVTEAYRKDPGQSLYHIGNAFTWVSTHDKEISRAQQIEFEKIGGELLTVAEPLTVRV